METKIFRPLLFSFMTFIGIFLVASNTFAIGIRPLRNELNVKPGESAKSEVTVVNETKADFMAEPIVQVFYKNDEKGFPIYPSKEEKQTENILSWLSISKQPILVPAGKSVTVPFIIKVPSNAIAGGKYLTIAYQPIKKEKGSGISTNVRAASLLYITVEGKVTQSAEVSQFALPSKLAGDQPFVFEVGFKNTGNIYLKPKGSITILDAATNTQITGITQYADPKTSKLINSDVLPLNLNESSVLPGSLRIFRPEWNIHLKSGKFRAVLNLEYSDSAEPITQFLDFEIDESLKVKDFSTHLTKDTSNFSLTINNSGKSYEKFTGAIAIKNALGQQVAEVPVPTTMDYLAPGETRTFNLNWMNTKLPPDKYTAQLAANYGFLKSPLTAETKFGNQGSTKMILGIVLGLVILFGLGALFRKKR